jgi:hypothetical protein
MPSAEQHLPKTEISEKKAWDLTIRLGALSLREDSTYLSPLESDYRSFLESLNDNSESKDHENRFDATYRRINMIKNTLAPYIGNLVVGKSRSMVFSQDKDWHELQTGVPFFATGRISGIESHPVKILRFFGGANNYQAYSPKKPENWPVNFRTGVVVDIDGPPRCNDSYTKSYAPPTDTILIPIYNFPIRANELRLWPDQIMSPHNITYQH